MAGKKKSAKKAQIKKIKESEGFNNIIHQGVEVNINLKDQQVDNSLLESKRKTSLVAIFAGERILIEKSDVSNDLYNQSRFGVILEDGNLQLSLLEALYLFEKNKVKIFTTAKGKKSLTLQQYLKKAKKLEPSFWIRYLVFKDLRQRGYIVKTALKFGADFRVYDRGIKPGEDHARWVVYPVHEGSTLTWYDFAAKNRVAHSTKKRLLMGVVDDENDVTYYEIRWMRP